MTYASTTWATFENMLGTLDHLAARAQEAGMGDDVLCARLAPDMYPLEQQFRIAGQQIVMAVKRVAGAQHELDDEPYSSFSEIRDRIAALREIVRANSSANFVPADGQIDMVPRSGLHFVLTAEEYLRDWTMPNFYFHVTMVYALLRKEGLDIGKRDFLGHMANHAVGPT